MGAFFLSTKDKAYCLLIFVNISAYLSTSCWRATDRLAELSSPTNRQHADSPQTRPQQSRTHDEDAWYLRWPMPPEAIDAAAPVRAVRDLLLDRGEQYLRPSIVQIQLWCTSRQRRGKEGAGGTETRQNKCFDEGCAASGTSPSKMVARGEADGYLADRSTGEFEHLIRSPRKLSRGGPAPVSWGWMAASINTDRCFFVW